jgi:cell division protein FtsI/penicillin-binding protein 2
MWQDRQYPLGSLAGQLVGFVGREGRGLEGAEAVFNTELAGQPGELSYVRDSRRRPIAFDDRGYLAPRDGEAVTLSLDLKLQAIVQEELSRTCAEFTAESGHVVMMNPFTGEVLAMASFPFFDPREALGMLEAMKPAAAGEVDKSPRPWQNRSVTEVFEPGSTFKTFVWAAATQGRHARVDEIFHCGGGSWVSSRGRSLRDAAPVGTVTWAQVLVKSSNIGMAMVGERMGPSRLHRAVRAFGFGQTTGSGLQGEQAGLVVPLSKWTHYSVTSVPMGQEVAVTGLQMCRATAAIANGGLMVAPTLRRVDADDYARDAQVIERVLDPNAAATTLATLRRVATEGTARQMKSSPYAIFGKTGTAQVPRTGNDLKRFGPGYEPNAYTACFIGGAPVEAPRVVVACFIRKPDKSKGYYGGIVAGPCVQRILERTLQYLGVPHSPREEPQPTVTALAAPRR